MRKSGLNPEGREYTLLRRLARVFETKLAYKIWLDTALPILLIFVCAMLALNMYFNAFLADKAVAQGNGDTTSAATKFSDTYEDMMQRLVSHIALQSFREKCVDIINSDGDDYTVVNNDVQGDLNDFMRTSGLVQGAVLTRTDNKGNSPMVFSSYVFRLNIARDEYTLGYDLSTVEGITILPADKSPFQSRGAVIPMVIPLRINGYQYMLISEDLEKSDLLLYILLDADSVADYLELCCDDSSEGDLFLVDSNGVNLSMSAEDPRYEKATDEDLTEKLRSAIEEGSTYFQYHDLYVFVSEVKYSGMYVVNVVDRSTFLDGTDSLVDLMQILAVTCILVITGVCMLISVVVTRPLRSLMDTVQQIEHRAYDGKTRLTTEDELGQLETAINSMYHIIQHQFKAIKHEERERYNAEMQMLTEQVNPHFLYNTLEFINMEVYNDRPETASEMITNLGDYIRISLSAGNNIHTLESEIEQVMAYVDIMSCRFSKPIGMVVNVPDELRPRMILKSILQPLVENSLKHGFDINGGGVPITPNIEISAEISGSELCISVIDNGAGIDVERARQIMYTKRAEGSREQHVGLNNVYQRLHSYYGNVNITFSSIPYFRNTITIHLPACFFDGSGTEPPKP